MIVATCSRGLDGEYFSHDLAQEQTLERLYALGDKMERVYKLIRSRAKSPGAAREGEGE